MDQNIPFTHPGNLSIRPIGPEIFEIEQVVRVDQYVLPSVRYGALFAELRLTIPSVQKTE